MPTSGPATTDHRPIRMAGSHLTPAHEALRREATKCPASTSRLGLASLLWARIDPGWLVRFGNDYVYERRVSIIASASCYDLPPQLVAGVVYNEIYWRTPLKPLVYALRTLVPFTADRDRTSLAHGMQLRRAAEALGYEPTRLGRRQRAELRRSLRDDREAIFLLAKHLSDLREVDFPGRTATDLSPRDAEIIGTRYNFGPEPSLTTIEQRLSYGRAITRRWRALGILLAVAPPAASCA
jgi:hypothetical protein